MESMKESAANVAATAKAGMDKTKATVQEKMEKITARDPLAKEIAEEKKQAKIHEAELNKKEALRHNAGVKHAATAAAGTHGTHSTHGAATYSTAGTHAPTAAGAHGMHPTHGAAETYSTTTGAVGTHGMHPSHGAETYSTTGTQAPPTAAGAHGMHTTKHETTTYSTPTGTESYTTGTQLPGHGTGQPTGRRLTEGVVGTETERTTPAHNPRVGGPGTTGYGT